MRVSKNGKSSEKPHVLWRVRGFFNEAPYVLALHLLCRQSFWSPCYSAKDNNDDEEAAGGTGNRSGTSGTGAVAVQE